MIKELMHDPFFLGVKSKEATIEDKQVGQDLLDTLRAHAFECVGMAANMIGVQKRIICFSEGNNFVLMYNPVIVKKSREYDTEEGCLSLLGGPRPTKRYEVIEVEYLDKDFRKRKRKYIGFPAQIIQHEVDHCDGILI